MTLSDSILSRIKDGIKEVAPDSRTILYGSQARGDARPDSDIDLLILLPDSYEGKDFVRKKFSIFDRLYELSMELEIDISPLVTVNKVYYARKTPFTVNITNEGIVLYDGQT